MAKMSKSVGNTIELLEDPNSIWEKLRTAPTDPARVRRNDPGDPNRCLIFKYHTYFSPPEVQAAVAEGCRTAGIGCVDCKKLIFDRMMEVLGPIQERAAELRQNPEVVEAALEDGARRARAIAHETMHEVRVKIGLFKPY